MDTPRKILLVEDDPFLVTLLKAKLSREGFEILHAKDGQEAIDILRKGKPDLILLDIILPQKSGFEVLEEVRSDPQLRGIPVIIISNLGQTGDIEKGKELGVIEYFVKAKISVDELSDKVKEFLKT